MAVVDKNITMSLGQLDSMLKRASNGVAYQGLCCGCFQMVQAGDLFADVGSKIYHLACFHCSVCNQNLDEKPYYIEDGKLYCPEDHANTVAPRCSLCTKPILDEYSQIDENRKLHKDCFKCEACGCGLVGQPFHDEDNKYYCAVDFQKMHASTCAKCQLQILATGENSEYIVLEDKQFHVACYSCVVCKQLLQGRDAYAHGDDFACEDHKNSS